MKTYFLEVSMIWLTFLSLYWFWLRKEKLLLSNRWYLLLTMTLGLVLPLVSLPNWVGSSVVTLEVVEYWLEPVTIIASSGEPVGSGFGWNIPWLTYLFVLGCCLAAGRLVYGLWGIFALLRKAHIVRRHGVLMALLPDNQPPFSWGPYLFWSEKNGLSDREEAVVIAHEKAHIQQGHSWDVLYLELIGILFWWNPLWHLYRFALRNLHEYLADAAASRGINLRHYGKLLLRQALNPDYPRISHAFHSSTIKSRIAMLTKSENSRWAAWKYLLVLPLLALVLYACSTIDGNTKEELQQQVGEYAFIEQIDTVITFDMSDHSESTEYVKNIIYKEAQEMPIFGNCPGLDGQELTDCSNRNMLEYIYTNIKYPKESRQAKVEGMVLTRIYLSKTGKVERAEIARSVGESEEMTENKRTVVVVGYDSDDPKALGSLMKAGIDAIDNEVKRVAESMPDFQPATINEEPVAIMLTLPVKFKLQ